LRVIEASVVLCSVSLWFVWVSVQSACALNTRCVYNIHETSVLKFAVRLLNSLSWTALYMDWWTEIFQSLSLPSCFHVEPRCLLLISHSLPILSQVSAVYSLLITCRLCNILTWLHATLQVIFMRFSCHSAVFVSSRDLYACCQNVNENSVLILTVTPYICIWEVLNLNPNWDTNFPGRYLVGFPESVQANARTVPQLGQSFYYSVLYSLDIDSCITTYKKK
jgi:hypothetical protein